MDWVLLITVLVSLFVLLTAMPSALYLWRRMRGKDTPDWSEHDLPEGYGYGIPHTRGGIMNPSIVDGTYQGNQAMKLAIANLMVHEWALGQKLPHRILKPHRTFSLRIGEQGSDHNADDWVIALDMPVMEGGEPLNPQEVEEFKAEILERFKNHLDSCMSAGYWNFEISSTDWPYKE